jgi:hypothetical protein
MHATPLRAVHPFNKPVHIMEKRRRFLGGASKIQEDTASVVKNRCSVGYVLRADYLSAVAALS